MRYLALILFALYIPTLTEAAEIRDHYFYSKDGTRLHYLEAGQGPESIVFIPGWLMPAAIFRLQLEELGKHYRVLAFDPRSQGKSAVGLEDHDVNLRMSDMQDFMRAAGIEHFILAGWSLGVLESLDFIERQRPPGMQGLILIDNSIGAGKPPAARPGSFFENLQDDERRRNYLTNFTNGMFKQSAPVDILRSALDSVLQAPGKTAIRLISQPYPRTYWRDIVYRQTVPVLYAVRPHLKDQGNALIKRKGSKARVEVFDESGHALFVDDATRFNAIVSEFARQIFSAYQPQTFDQRYPLHRHDEQSGLTAFRIFSGS